MKYVPNILCLFSLLLGTSLFPQDQTIQQQSVIREDNGGIRAPNDSLSRKELIEYKKELLLHELTSDQLSIQLRNDHKWELRLLFAVLGVSFLSLVIAEKTSKNMSKIPKIWSGVLIIFIFLLVLVYDLQVASLSESTNKRKMEVANLLNALPDTSIAAIKDIKIYIDNREHLKKDSKGNKLSRCLAFAKRWWNRIYQIGQLEIILFYTWIGSIFFFGWYLLYVKK